MTDAIAAHLRLLEQLRERIRTHECEPSMRQRGMKYKPQEKETLRERLLECFKRGLDRKRAALECGCTNKTIVRLLGKTKRGRPRKCK